MSGFLAKYLNEIVKTILLQFKIKHFFRVCSCINQKPHAFLKLLTNISI